MGDAYRMDDKNRRRAIAEQIAALGPVLPGSIVLRSTRCQTPGCRCRAEPPQLHGPYATWIHQKATRTLSPEEADRLAPMIEAHRRLKDLVRELEEITVADVRGNLR
jgi:hypothetical protein